MRILVVDDSNTMRLLLVKMLHEMGYTEINAVASSEEAIPLIWNEQFDVILLDWNLPKMSGLDLVKYLKTIPNAQKIQIIMITTVHDRSAILKALKEGVQGYILKPIAKDVLSAKLHEIKEKKAAVTE